MDAVGVDPIAWRIATTMPALLPFLPVGSASQLGEAVARLTGLADLVDLAKHAEKMAVRIKKSATSDLERDRNAICMQYQQAVDDLAGIVDEVPKISFGETVPAVGDESAKDQIAKIGSHFGDLKAAALRDAQDVLGVGFDPENKQARDDLESSIGPAIERLKAIVELPSIARLSVLSLEPHEASDAAALLDQIAAEASTLAQLSINPDQARRAQLYARVSAWMHEHEHVDDGTCPVCVGQLEDASDPVTGKPVTDHLAGAARDRQVIARTISEWSTHWCGYLLQELPSAIANEARHTLPKEPSMLLRSGLVEELFGTDPFSGALAALRPDATELVDDKLASLPSFVEPSARPLPEALKVAGAPLQQIVDRVVRALAFAEWRTANGAAIKSFLQGVRNGAPDDPEASRAIGSRLTALLGIVEAAAPLNAAMEQLRRMEAARQTHSEKATRITACERAVTALEILAPLGGLAQTQVETLRRKLHNRSEHWRRAIYRNATTFAPDLTGTEMDARGVLELKVGRDGVTAPAQHISNASALRGALFGFFLAFREHVITTRGGLSLLLLDDPQELLDHDNRQRLSHGLAAVAGAGAQLFITTHDRRFARSVVAENRAADRVHHLSVHAVNSVHPTLSLSPTIEEVDRRRQAFINAPDSAPEAQNYASDMRVFIEGRVSDLFDDLAEPAHASSTQALTLFPLLDKLRGLISNGSGELFTNPVLKRFVDDPGLAEGARPRRVLNTSHHDKTSITYMDVKDVEKDFVRLRTGVEKAHEQFRLHRWREPLAPAEATDINVAQLPTVQKPTFSVPLCPDIAAFAGPVPTGGSQDIATEQLDGSWFEDKALFYVRGETLGFAIPSGAVAIVEAAPYPGHDRNLVIARYQGNVLARRLVKATGSVGISLAAQMPDPRIPRPTVSFDESKVRLYQIVGAVFTDAPPPPAGGGEATSIDEVPELGQVEVAYRVREDSAVPLALPGQIILGGAELALDELDGWEGKLVAVSLDDGTSIFKRVGARLSGDLAHLRLFETIGGLGSSMVVATEPVEGGVSAPMMASARRVLGVLYQS
ncbi:MAG: hypothetical protein ACK4UQ_04625 [Brevundimonas sp.]